MLSVLAMLASGLLLVVIPAAPAQAAPTTFSTPGSAVQYVVPAGVNYLQVDLKGSAACTDSSLCPAGGRVQAIIATTPNTTYQVFVGGTASGTTGGWPNGGNGGDGDLPNKGLGGGGSTDLRANDGTTRIVVAGGGGGRGNRSWGWPFQDPPSSSRYRGGAGGEPNGSDAPTSNVWYEGKAGKGATQTVNGAGGNSCGCGENGSSGSSNGQGGNGGGAAALLALGGGGGGGGYRGGGGAGASQGLYDTAAHGGGGGSSWADPAKTTAGYPTSYLSAGASSKGSATITPLTAPVITTGATSAITANSATLGGTANAGSLSFGSVAVSVEYGTNPTLSSGTTTAAVSSLTGSTDTAVSKGLTGLSAGTTYYYRFKGTGLSVFGTVNGSIQSFTTNGAPTATTGSATVTLPSSAVLNGSVNANGFSTSISFVYGTDPALPTGLNGTTEVAATPASTTAQGATASVALSSLATSTTYYYQVKAVNSQGTRLGAIRSLSTSPAPIVTTSAADGLTGVAATLHGSVTANNLSTTTNFIYGTDPALNTGAESSIPASPSTVNGLSPTAISANISGLAASTTYYFKAQGTSSAGTGNGSILSFTTNSPPTPTTTSAINITHGAATLRGTVSTGGGSTTVRFVYGQDPGLASGNTTTALPAPVSPGSDPNAVSLDISGLSGNTTYFFRVEASNSVSGGFVQGSILTFTTNHNAPGAASVTSVTRGNGQLTISWTPGSSPATPLTGHSVQVCSDPQLADCGQDWMDITTTPTPIPGDATSAVATALTNGTPYWVRVASINVGGMGVYGVFGSATTPATVPAAPTLGPITPQPGKMVISWISNGSGGLPIEDWTVESCSLGTVGQCNSSGGWTPISEETPVTGDDRVATATGFTNPTRLWFRVGAENDVGDSPYAVSSSRVLAENVTSGDHFNQGLTPPVITVDPTDLDITPLLNGAAGPYLIPVNVEFANIDDLAKVDLCIYYTGTGGVPDGECDFTQLSPSREFELEWTTEDNMFHALGGPFGAQSEVSIEQNGQNGGMSTFNPSTETDALGLVFAFRPSSVMREDYDNNWKVRATVTTLDGDTASVNGDVDITVHHFSAITVQRRSQDFGEIENGASSVVDHVSAGTLIANGASDVTYQMAEDFRNEEHDETLFTATGLVDSAPGEGAVAYDCSATDVFDQDHAARLGTTQPVDVAQGVTQYGTSEGGADTYQSCRLWYGGTDGEVSRISEFQTQIITASTDD